MRDILRVTFMPYTVRREGRVRCMYLDTEGIVSGGIGFAFLRSADTLELGWLRDDLQPATPNDVTNEWRHVESLQGMRGHSWQEFLPVTSLRATDASIDALFARKMARAETAMLSAFPTWPTWTADAQFAAMSYCWAMGPDWPLLKFPHCSALLRAGRWSEVLDIDPGTGRPFCEMHLKPSSNSSLRARAADALVMWTNAAQSVVEGLDPETLYFPRALPGG